MIVKTKTLKTILHEKRLTPFETQFSSDLYQIANRLKKKNRMAS